MLTKNPYVHRSDLAQSLYEHFAAIHPSPTKIKSHYSRQVDEKLKTCSHVWFQNYFVKGALQPRY